MAPDGAAAVTRELDQDSLAGMRASDDNNNNNDSNKSRLSPGLVRTRGMRLNEQLGNDAR